MLSTSSWFFFGAGELYGAPFRARCLLYRLHDINCSILIYHKRNITSVNVNDQTRDQIIRTLGPLNSPPFKVANVVASNYESVTEVLVHHMGSSTVSLSELIDSSPIRLNLSEDTSPQCQLRGISVILELAHLPVKEMLRVYPEQDKMFEQPISETCYWVRGAVDVVENPFESVFQRMPEAQNSAMRSWKLSVGDPVSKEYYALSQSRNWELAALDVKDDWKVTSAMYLEKRG